MDAVEIEKLAELEGTHWWYAERRAMLARAISGVTPGDAVDVGAGAGGNTKVLADAGWRTAAVELSRVGAKLAKSRGTAIIRADARNLPFANEQFDLLVSMDLWEHIEDDRSAAAEALRVLRSGGRAFIAVPCDMALWSDHDVAVGHVRRYEKQQLLDLVSGAGFQIVDIAYWNVLLRPVAKWRRKRDAGGSDLSRLPEVVNAGLRTIVAAERFLPVQRLPGVSLVVRARRPFPN